MGPLISASEIDQKNDEKRGQKHQGIAKTSILNLRTAAMWLSTFGSRSKKRSRLRKRSVPPSKVLRQPWKTLEKPRHRFRFKRLKAERIVDRSIDPRVAANRPIEWWANWVQNEHAQLRRMLCRECRLRALSHPERAPRNRTTGGGDVLEFMSEGKLRIGASRPKAVRFCKLDGVIAKTTLRPVLHFSSRAPQRYLDRGHIRVRLRLWH